MVICLDRGADLQMAQLMPLPLTVSCFSKIQIGFTFLVPAYPGSPEQQAFKRVCVCVFYTAASLSHASTFIHHQVQSSHFSFSGHLARMDENAAAADAFDLSSPVKRVHSRFNNSAKRPTDTHD